MDTNYIAGIIRILEFPKQQVLVNNSNSSLVTSVRAQLYNYRNSPIVTLTFWGSLAYDTQTIYKKHDYFIVEGFLSIRETIEITVLRAHPIFLNYYI